MRIWSAIALVVLLASCGSDIAGEGAVGHPRSEADVAECQDGTFSDNTSFSATCSSHGGLKRWLATYGECVDGMMIKMSDDASCSDNDGFKGLLPVDFEPTAGEGDVAQCQDGSFSDNTSFSATCSSHNGVERWLSAYGECVDGTLIKMSDEASCSSSGGFKGLMPADYEPPATTTAPPVTAPPTTQAIVPLVPTTRPPAPTSPPSTTPPPTSPPSAHYANCSEARAAGAAPLYRGEPGYAPRLDRDGDGIACE